MRLTQENRKYRIDDANLIMLTEVLICYLERDLNSLATLGLTQDKINELKVLNNIFKNTPIDSELKGTVMNATQEKQTIVTNIKEEIRLMALRCRMKWGANSSEEQTLGLTGIGNFTNENLLVASRRVYQQMTNYLPELLEYGLTQALLDNLEDMNIQLEYIMNTQKDCINTRLKSTRERIRIGNQIYAYVAKYCEMGKYCYANTNPSKYKDYIIYHDNKRKSKKAITIDNNKDKKD